MAKGALAGSRVSKLSGVKKRSLKGMVSFRKELTGKFVMHFGGPDVTKSFGIVVSSCCARSYDF